jgi:iron(III) transport system permease protein
MQLSGRNAWWLTLFCAVPVVAGFVIPVSLLISLSIDYFDVSWTPEFRQYAFNSILLSGLAAIFAVLIALLITYTRRLSRNSRKMLFISRVASLGYAVPGAVLAVGVIIPFAAWDNWVDGLARQWLGISTGLLLSGSIFAVLFAYVVRFLAVSIGSIESSLSKVSESMDMAARTLGYPAHKVLIKFHLPLIQSGILTAAMVVFVDSMKELPATLILRPFNFETLATYVYQFASDEMIGESALGALFIVLAGLIPVIFLSRTISRSNVIRSVPDTA